VNEEWTREQCLRLVDAALRKLEAKRLARERKQKMDPDPILLRIALKMRKYEVLYECLMGDEPLTAIAHRLGWVPPVNGHTMRLDELEVLAAQFIEDTYPIDNDVQDTEEEAQ